MTRHGLPGVWLALTVLPLLLLLSWPLAAHQASDGLLVVDARNGAVTAVTVELLPGDLDAALGLDTDRDGVLRWGEVHSARAALASYVRDRLSLSVADEGCTLGRMTTKLNRRRDRQYVQLGFDTACPALPGSLDVHYQLLFDIDAQHRAIVLNGDTERAVTRVVSRDKRQVRLPLAANHPSRAAAVSDYFVLGMEHVWEGLDHLLFVLTLLLPVPLVRRAGQWRPAPSAAVALLASARLVTAFTVGHSVSLMLATYGWLSLPASLVEPAIALSVVLAAVNNLTCTVRRYLWLAALGFGLVHGLGFAGALADIGLPSGAGGAALLGFNLGVEAGQLAVVAVFVPLAYGLRRSGLYRRSVLPVGSTVIAMTGAAWLVQRLAA